MALQHLPQVHPRRHPNGVEDDVHRRAVLQKRHILLRQNAGNNPLVAVPPGHLVPHRNLARLRHPHPDGLVHIRRQRMILLVPVALLDGDNLAPLPVRHPQRCIPHILGLLPENRPQQPLLGGHLRLPFGRNLPHQNVPRPHLGADADNPPLVQIPQIALPHIGNVPRDFLLPQLGVAAQQLVLLNMHRGEQVVLRQPLAQDDGVLVVVALPGHKRHQHILPQRQLPAIGGRTVGQRVPRAHIIALLHHRTLVEASPLVSAIELDEPVRVFPPAVVGDDDFLPVDRQHRPIRAGHQHLPAVLRHPPLNPRADHRRLRLQQRHRLPLHIAAHQRPVGVIMLQKRNQRRRHAHNLQRRHIRILHHPRRHLPIVVPFPHLHQILGELVQMVKLGAGLRDTLPFLPIRRQVMHAFRAGIHKRRHLDHQVVGQPPQPPQAVLVNHLPGGNDHIPLPRLDILGHPMPPRVKVTRQPRRAAVPQPQLLDHRPVGGFNKPQPVNPRVSRQAAQQPDVRPLRRLNGADAPVVRSVDIPHIKARPLPRQPAPTQGRKTPLVRQLGQRVGLIHKLRQLVPPEKLPDGAGYRPHINQLVRYGILRLFQPRHPILHHPVHPQQPHPNLIPDQLAGHPHPPVPQMVNVVPRLLIPRVQADELPQRVNDVAQLQIPPFRQGNPRQVETHLVHIPVGAGIHLRNHPHDVRRPRPHRRQPPRLQRPLADPRGVNQLPGLHNAGFRQKAVLEHPHFPLRHRIAGRAPGQNVLHRDGRRRPHRLRNRTLHRHRNDAIPGLVPFPIIPPFPPRQQRGPVGRIGAANPHYSLGDGDGAVSNALPIPVAVALADPDVGAGEQIQRLNPPVSAPGQIAVVNQRIHIPIRQYPMRQPGILENLRRMRPRARFGVPPPHKIQNALLPVGQQLRFGTPQPLVNLDAPHFPQVKPVPVEKMVQHKSARRIHLHRRLPGPQPLVQVALRQPDAVRLLPGKLPVRMHPIPQRTQLLRAGIVVPIILRRSPPHEKPALPGVHIPEQRPYLLRADDAQRVQKGGHAHPPAPVHAYRHRFRQIAPPGVVVRPGGKLNARPPDGRNPRVVIPVLRLPAVRAFRVLRRLPFVINAGRPLQLAHQHPFRPVDDESPRLGHHRHIAKKDALALLNRLPADRIVPPGHLDFARLQILQPGVHIQRLRVGNLQLLALLQGVLRRVKIVASEIKLVPLRAPGGLGAGKTPGNARHNRRTFLQNLRQPPGGEPVKGLLLAAEQVGNFQRIGDAGIGVSLDIAGRQPAIVAARAFPGQNHSWTLLGRGKDGGVKTGEGAKSAGPTQAGRKPSGSRAKAGKEPSVSAAPNNRRQSAASKASIKPAATGKPDSSKQSRGKRASETAEETGGEGTAAAGEISGVRDEYQPTPDARICQS